MLNILLKGWFANIEKFREKLKLLSCDVNLLRLYDHRDVFLERFHIYSEHLSNRSPLATWKQPMTVVLEKIRFLKLGKIHEKFLEQILFLISYRLKARRLTKIELLCNYFPIIFPKLMVVTHTIF